VDLSRVWKAFTQVTLLTPTEIESRSLLAKMLVELAESRDILLPKSASLWDQHISNPLPNWIELVRPSANPSTSKNLQPDPKSIAWPYELRAAGQRAPGPWLDDLLAIKEFLATGGRTRPFVPIRERSLELFGDEKRLDALLKSTWFRDEILSLELLRAREVVPPLVVDRVDGAQSATYLALENLHTFDSFRRWNRTRRRYAGVVYGHGNQFSASVADFMNVSDVALPVRLEYFGDLDPAGLHIVGAARREIARLRLPISLVPADRWYRALLKYGTPVFTAVGPVDEDLREAIGWLPVELRSDVVDLFSRNKRLAQEAVGTDFLAKLGEGIG
jgi:hypothetical protein